MLNFLSLIVSLSVNLNQFNSANSPVFYLYQNLLIQDSIPLQNLIKKEINQTKIRFNPILHTWILAAILIPTSATFCVLVLAFKYGRKVKSVSANITTIQSQTLSQMKSRISEAQIMFNSVQDQIKTSQEKVNSINEKVQIFSNERNKDGN